LCGNLFGRLRRPAFWHDSTWFCSELRVFGRGLAGALGETCLPASLSPQKEKAANTFRMLAALESSLQLIYGYSHIHRVIHAS
jgi:hypothetical protein